MNERVLLPLVFAGAVMMSAAAQGEVTYTCGPEAGVLQDAHGQLHCSDGSTPRDDSIPLKPKPRPGPYLSGAYVCKSGAELLHDKKGGVSCSDGTIARFQVGNPASVPPVTPSDTYGSGAVGSGLPPTDTPGEPSNPLPRVP